MPGYYESRVAIRDAITPATAPAALVSQRDAAEAARLSRRQITNMINDGRLATMPVGTRTMVLRHSLEQLIETLNGRRL